MRIILDTDMGMGVPGTEIDDGFALALLLADEAFKLELVTTVNGNIDVESGTFLSVELLRRLNRPDIPVIRGAGAPLGEPENVRGASEAVRDEFGHHNAAPGYAAAEIASRIMAAPGDITLVAIGPLTNIAAAINLEPQLASNVKEIVIMGGAFLEHTNERRMPGEFNIWVDPDAARAVFRSGAPLRLVGLDVTTQVRLTRNDAEAMAASGRPFGEFAGESTLAWIDRMGRRNPGDPRAGESCAMHDALAVAAISRPELLTWADAHVDVVTRDPVGRRVTVADLLTSAVAPAANCQIATDVDVDQFMSYFLDRIIAY